MTSLWTPSGEHRPDDTGRGEPGHPPPAGPPGGGEPDPAELARLRDQLLATPVATIVANHAIGMWELAALHLGVAEGPDGASRRPDLEQARLALDAVAAVVEGLGDRLGEHAPVLRDALAQLRLAFVQVAQQAAQQAAGRPPGGDPPPGP